MGRRLRHKRSGIVAVRTVPAPTVLFRKDGAGPVRLARELSFDALFSIRPWAVSVVPTLRSGRPTFPGVLGIPDFGGVSGRAEGIAKYHNSNCWTAFLGSTLRIKIAMVLG